MNTEEPRVLGSFNAEMNRRRQNAAHFFEEDRWSVIAAAGLLFFGVWPLGFWHALAVVAGVAWGLCIAEEQSARVADEVDRLEDRIVARLEQMSAG
jgi:uncharacterized membrane protein YiaA